MNEILKKICWNPETESNEIMTNYLIIFWEKYTEIFGENLKFRNKIWWNRAKNLIKFWGKLTKCWEKFNDESLTVFSLAFLVADM